MRYWNNKWGKYRAISLDKTISRHLPATKLASEEHVRSMLKAFRSVYLKPIHGTGGFGIAKLSLVRGGYRLQYGASSRDYRTFKEGFRAFRKMAGKKRYLVQKGISLIRYADRPLDLRVMVQRHPTRSWVVTGMVGRVAKAGKIVTNYHNGGRPMPVDQLLNPLVGKQGSKACMNRLKHLSLHVSKHMSTVFPQFNAYGIDIGLDQAMKPWIIEVNTRPDKHIFHALPDKQMYRTVLRYDRMTQNHKSGKRQ